MCLSLLSSRYFRQKFIPITGFFALTFFSLFKTYDIFLPKIYLVFGDPCSQRLQWQNHGFLIRLAEASTRP